MAHSKKWFMILGASASICGSLLYAQDDLDALLSDLGEDTAPKKTQEASVKPKAEKVEEKKAEAAPAPAAVAEEKKAEAAPAPAVAAEEKKAEAAPAPVVSDNDALVSELEKLEEIRRKAMDDHGRTALKSADESLSRADYEQAVKEYKKALEFICKRAENEADLDKARKGIAEALYRDALLEIKNGDLEQAKKRAIEAREANHPLAAQLFQSILDMQNHPVVVKPDTNLVNHRVNEYDHKLQRTEIRKRMRRSRQYLATGEYEKALEQCELVLRDHPDTQEAISLRSRIAKKMMDFSNSEFEASRAMMIRQVRDTWNTKRYAIDSTDVPKGKMEMTTKRQASEIVSGRTSEQVIQQKMEDIVLPEVSFRPPATIIDAVDFFNNAAREYDNPELPIEQRGVNLVLKLPGGAANAGAAQAESASENDPFAASAGNNGAAGGSGNVPVIPALSARFITLKNALKLVCDVTGMKSLVRGNVVMVVPANEPDTELITRSYNVLASLTDRIQSAQSEMGSSNKKNDDTFLETQDMSAKQDWKVFFGDLGVQWPEGSSIAYISTIGKLRVKNTAENLAVFEQVLEDLNVTPRLIEIEARFVDVSQEDLNSLGFEWLLNGDFTFGLGGVLGKNLRKYTSLGGGQSIYDSAGNVIGTADYSPYRGGGRLTGTALGSNQQGQWAPNGKYLLNNGTVVDGALGGNYYGNVFKYNHNGSINAIDGNTYSTGMRYLNTNMGNGGNHISTMGVNDQFMRINAFLGNADLSLILHMLSQRSDTDLLNAPRVVAKNGQEAVMKVVTEYIYPTEYDVEISEQDDSSSSNYGGGMGGVVGGISLPPLPSDPIATVEPQNFEMREVGTILQVVPEVSPEGQMINLTLNPQVVSEPTWKNYGTQIPTHVYKSTSSILGDILSAADLLGILKTMPALPAVEYYTLNMEQPFFSVRSVNTQLSVYNGATVVIGGLITENRKTMEDKIPFLGDIPYIGRLFRSRSELSQKRNLLIFITAKLVDPAGKVIRQTEGDSLATNVGGSAQGGEKGAPAKAAAAAPAAAGDDAAATGDDLLE